eukprot:Tamp_11775.p1 GENE.Tamp_11775~~Tamp_11775.p1  ORF type:complete len:409 (-),score=45.43 Tamp_11775:195-1421(-)
MPQLPLEIEGSLRELAEHCAQNGERVWGYFQENSLRWDNHVLDDRFNLIALATCPLDNTSLRSLVPAEHQQQWHVLRGDTRHAQATVVAVMAVLAARDAYVQYPHLFVWDLVCCCVALARQEAHIALCKGSVFNSENAPNVVQECVTQICARASSDTPLLVALQEWPSAGSHKHSLFLEALRGRSCSVVEGRQSVAIAYSTSLSCQDLTDTFDASDLISQVVSADATLDARDVKGLYGTTSRKILAARFSTTSDQGVGGGVVGGGVTVLAIHAKEPKTVGGARALARVILTIAQVLPKPWVAMSDTNMATAELAAAFALEMRTAECEVVPEANVDTTSKYRSLLHGQTYNASKSLVVVKGPKDKIMCSAGCALTSTQVFPDIEKGSTLPRTDWVSDHCFVSALMTASL